MAESQLAPAQAARQRIYNRAEVSCRQCGGKFTVPHYRRETAKYCGHSCKGVAHAAERFNKGPKPWAAANLEGHRHKSTSRFKPGFEPWNKGVEGLRLSPHSEFKKGRASEIKEEIGAEKARTRRGETRYFVKVAQPSVWVPRARFVWEANNGPLPAGHVVHHIDRNPQNDAIENLQAMTRSEHAREHYAENRAAIACRRVDEATRQPDLLINYNPPPKPVQTEFFNDEA